MVWGEEGVCIGHVVVVMVKVRKMVCVRYVMVCMGVEGEGVLM